MFKEGSHASLFLELAKPNAKGFSREVKLTEFVGKYKKLDKFGNGASWGRRDGSLGNKYNIHRVKNKGKIVAVQLHGFNKSPPKVPVPKAVREKYKKDACRILATSSQIEIDHKDGRYDDPSIDADGFQPLSRSVNLAKRNHCIKCKETDKRFDARVLGYKVGQVMGNGVYRGSCTGCYWHDPQFFNQEISKLFVKEE